MQVEGCAQVAPAPGSLSCSMVVAITETPTLVQSSVWKQRAECVSSGVAILTSPSLKLRGPTDTCAVIPAVVCVAALHEGTITV